MAFLISSRRGPTHHVLVESKRGKDYKAFSVWMPTADRQKLKTIMVEAVQKALVLLSDEWRTGVDNDKQTHKIRLQASRTLGAEQRYVTSKTIHKPFHSSEEVAEALKSVLSEEGYL